MVICVVFLFDIMVITQMRGREENIVGIFFRQIFAETTQESGQIIDIKTVFLAVFQNEFIHLQCRHVLLFEALLVAIDVAVAAQELHEKRIILRIIALRLQNFLADTDFDIATAENLDNLTTVFQQLRLQREPLAAHIQNERRLAN